MHECKTHPGECQTHNRENRCTSGRTRARPDPKHPPTSQVSNPQTANLKYYESFTSTSRKRVSEYPTTEQVYEWKNESETIKQTASDSSEGYTRHTRTIVRHTYTSVGHTRVSVGHTHANDSHTHVSVKHTCTSVGQPHANDGHTHVSVRHTCTKRNRCMSGRTRARPSRGSLQTAARVSPFQTLKPKS